MSSCYVTECSLCMFQFLEYLPLRFLWNVKLLCDCKFCRRSWSKDGCNEILVAMCSFFYAWHSGFDALACLLWIIYFCLWGRKPHCGIIRWVLWVTLLCWTFMVIRSCRTFLVILQNSPLVYAWKLYNVQQVVSTALNCQALVLNRITITRNHEVDFWSPWTILTISFFDYCLLERK